MFRSWKIGTAFGIGVHIHPTFWILPVIFAANGLSIGLGYVALTLVVLAGTMACVVLHEFGHALMARYFGIRTRDITLYPIGGVARLERLSEKPLEEVLIALAGPAVNVVIAVLLFPFVVLTNPSLGLPDWRTNPVGFFLVWLLVTNVFLALFNLIPAFPMDGGRVLRALLSMPFGRLRATEIAASLGLVIAVLFGLGFIFLRNVEPFFNQPMLILVAVFIAFVGQRELAFVRYQESARRAREAAPEVVSATPILYDVTGEPIRPGFSGFLWDGRLRAWVLWRDGRPVASYGAGPE
jgi:Zn-dependent protease